MRNTVEPPPISRCELCGGQLTLVRVEPAHSALGATTNVFACACCGNERTFVAHQDHGSSRFGATDYRLRS